MFRTPLAAALALVFAGATGSAPEGPGMAAIRLDDGRMLAVSGLEVSVGDWRECHRDGGCSLALAPGTSDDMPVTGVSMLDVEEYLAWASLNGHRFRLPTMAEWNSFAGELRPVKKAPRFTDPRLAWAADYGNAPVDAGPLMARGAYRANRAGIADLEGPVWEWTSSCASPNFAGDPGRCPAFLAAGLHEAPVSVFVRDPALGGCALGTPPAHLGFRLVSDAAP